MRSYDSGAELAAEIAKRGKLFIGEFADIPDDDWDRLIDGLDRTPRQMVAYQLGWMDLLLGWERSEQAGAKVVTPAPGYNGINSAVYTTRSISAGRARPLPNSSAHFTLY